MKIVKLNWYPTEVKEFAPWESGSIHKADSPTIVGPILPLEFSRIEPDGTLSFVIDQQNGRDCPTTAIPVREGGIEEASANLERSVGKPSPTFQSAVRGENSQIKAIDEWLASSGFEAAIWRSDSPNFETHPLVSRAFSPQAAQDWVRSQPIKVRNRIYGYICNAPDSIDTPLRQFLRWPEAIAIHEAGHLVLASCLSGHVEEVWIDRPNRPVSGCRWNSDPDKYDEYYLFCMAGAMAQIEIFPESVAAHKIEKFKSSLIAKQHESSIYKWTGWEDDLKWIYTADPETAFKHKKQLTNYLEAIPKLLVHLRRFLARDNVQTTIKFVAESLIEKRDIRGEEIRNLNATVMKLLSQGDIQAARFSL